MANYTLVFMAMVCSLFVVNFETESRQRAERTKRLDRPRIERKVFIFIFYLSIYFLNTVLRILQPKFFERFFSKNFSEAAMQDR